MSNIAQYVLEQYYINDLNVARSFLSKYKTCITTSYLYGPKTHAYDSICGGKNLNSL